MLRFQHFASSINVRSRIVQSRCVASIVQKPLRLNHHGAATQQKSYLRYNFSSLPGQESCVRPISLTPNLIRTKHIASSIISSLPPDLSGFHTNAKPTIQTTPQLQPNHVDNDEISQKDTTTKDEDIKNPPSFKPNLNTYLKWTLLGAAIIISISTTIIAIQIHQFAEIWPELINAINQTTESISTALKDMQHTIRAAMEEIKNIKKTAAGTDMEELIKENKMLTEENTELKRLLEAEQLKVSVFEDHKWHAHRYD